MEFLNLPAEIRLSIYSHLFDEGVVYVNGGRQDSGNEATEPCLFPSSASQYISPGRGGQVLRTCRTILAEASPVLYKNTTFRSSSQAFAGRLPTRATPLNAIVARVSNLEWQLHCDLLKSSRLEEVAISKHEVETLKTVQLTCQAEAWRGSFCGEWCDREAFVRGRQQVVDFAKLLRSAMSEDSDPISIIENTRGLSRGRVVLRIAKGRSVLGADVSIQRQFFLQLTDKWV